MPNIPKEHLLNSGEDTHSAGTSSIDLNPIKPIPVQTNPIPVQTNAITDATPPNISNNADVPPSIGTSIIVDVPMEEPIKEPINTEADNATNGSSVIVQPPVEPIPVVVSPVETPKTSTASVTITNVPLIGDGIAGILGSIGGIGGMGGGGGMIDEPQLNKEINRSMPNLLFYLATALVIIIGYKIIKKQ